MAKQLELKWPLSIRQHFGLESADASLFVGWVGLMLGYAALWWVGLLMHVDAPTEADDHETPEQWLAYPHARREMSKEIAFVAVPVIGALAGYAIAGSSTQLGAPWSALGAALFGYLVGGGLIWGIRILGTLAFGKEAMGLGDVHLLGAIGAVVGWVDATVVFFLAPFFGLAATAVMALNQAFTRGSVRAIPYGPYLAAAAIVLLLAREPIHAFLVILGFDTTGLPGG